MSVETDAIRFFNKVLVGDGCWEWQAGRDSSGYGRFYLNGRMTRASRAAWTLLVGEIPNGSHVLHACDNRRCVKPDHLFLGDHAANMADMAAKGRHWRSGQGVDPEGARRRNRAYYERRKRDPEFLERRRAILRRWRARQKEAHVAGS